jgi:hemerythrin superfamily protein
MAADHNLIDVIVTDHREVESAFGELESGELAADRRQQLVEHVITELVRHSVAEEMFMYPAARKHLSDGDKLADHEISEHAEVEEIMKALEGTDIADQRYDQLLTKLMADVRHHIQDEEQDLLPRLREACSADELAELGEKVINAKKFAPTRPHPAAPDTPPANLILAPGAGLIDRLRDALSGRNK